MLKYPIARKDLAGLVGELICQQARLAIVVTPNNPMPLLVPKDQLIYLAEKLAVRDCMLIVDESFIDFARNGDQETRAKK